MGVGRGEGGGRVKNDGQRRRLNEWDRQIPIQIKFKITLSTKMLLWAYLIMNLIAHPSEIKVTLEVHPQKFRQGMVMP